MNDLSLRSEVRVHNICSILPVSLIKSSHLPSSNKENSLIQISNTSSQSFKSFRNLRLRRLLRYQNSLSLSWFLFLFSSYRNSSTSYLLVGPTFRPLTTRVNSFRKIFKYKKIFQTKCLFNRSFSPLVLTRYIRHDTQTSNRLSLSYFCPAVSNILVLRSRRHTDTVECHLGQGLRLSVSLY